MKAQLLLERGTYIDTVVIKSVPIVGDRISYITKSGMKTKYRVVDVSYEFQCESKDYPKALIVLSLREEE